MNRTTMIIAAVVAVVILGLGAVFVLGRKTSSPSTAGAPAAQENNSNAITSIQDALTRSLTLRCDYEDDNSGTKTVAYVKNGMVRSDVTAANGTPAGSVIIKDSKMYFWNSTTAFVMSMPSITSAPAGGQASQGQSMMQALEKYKDSCHTATVEDSLFILPSGVKFQDMSTMTVPSGARGQGAAPAEDQAKMQQLIQKYAPSPAAKQY